MSIKLPKRLRGFSFDRVLPVELNTFDVDIVLPAVFFQVVSGGKDRGHMDNDSEAIAQYVRELAEHPDVNGFDNDAARRTLDRLVRTSLVRIGRKGQSGTREQIMGLTGYTFLAFKPGFPTESSSLRRVPSLIYRMLRDQMRSDETCRAFFKSVFGKGVDIEGGPEPNGRYDGHTQLDTLTRLLLAFLDGFKPTGVRNPREIIPPEPCPGLADCMAVELQRYLRTYRDVMPIEALTHNFRALINFELFAYSLKLFHAVVELVEMPQQLPDGMRLPARQSPPDIYLDFTGSAVGLSRDMAAACVRRDLETIQRFVWANFTLRQLDRYARELRGNRRISALVREMVDVQDKGPEYLQELLRLLEQPEVAMNIDALASRDETDIRRENAPAGQEDDEDIPNEEIDRLTRGARSSFEALVLLLFEAQRSRYTQNCVKWLYSVGGLTKSYGVLRGHLKSRQSWRYSPSNELLALLVQLAAVGGTRWSWSEPAPQTIQLRVFLDSLETRYGILVDQPPQGFDGSEHFAAAQENLRAMLRRLRQMGIFRDLSDDFTVQRLTPPYADISAGVQA